MMDLFKALYVTAWFALMWGVGCLVLYLVGVDIGANDGRDTVEFIGLHLFTVFSASLYTTSLKDG